MNLLEVYDDLLDLKSNARIHRQKEDRGIYYYEFDDCTYIRVEPNRVTCIYECRVLDPDQDFKKSMYIFHITFDSVMDAGSFEKVLVNVYNKVVRNILMNILRVED